jgi:hypothetical protein
MIERRFVLRSEFVVANLLKYLGGLSIEPPVEVIVRPYIEKRSLEQNARLWMLHSRAAEFVGCTAEDMHEEMLCKVYGYSEVRLPSGYMKRIPLKRSSARNRKEFHTFMEQVEAFYISELGVYLEQAA